MKPQQPARWNPSDGQLRLLLGRCVDGLRRFLRFFGGIPGVNALGEFRPAGTRALLHAMNRHATTVLLYDKLLARARASKAEVYPTPRQLDD